MSKKLKTRFAPSPTGYLHIGGARTALFNYLYAKKNNGTFLLRIEDTDVKREAENSYEKILEDMQWLGIQWDEGPIRQTDRLDRYKYYADLLLEKGMAYPCYCTPEELKEIRETAKENKETVRLYNGTCRHLSAEEREAKETEGRKPCLRFASPNKEIVVKDLIRGNVPFAPDAIGDFVIMKSDGTPSYNFAVVVDDHEMEVTLVMRGEEHLVNTPRQILLYNALEFELPQFAHISMILAPDRSKMSKRHGTVAVGEYRNQGFLPEALINYISLLGWSPEGEREFYTLSEMEQIFGLDRIAPNPAVYDVEKLKWMNAHYIKETDNEKLLALLMPYLKETDFYRPEFFEGRHKAMLDMVEAVKPRISLLSDIAREAKIFFNDDFEIEEAAKEIFTWDTTPKVAEAFLKTVEEMGNLNDDNFMAAVGKIQELSGAKGKKLYMPLRACVTGQAHGVEMKFVLTVLTKEQLVKRLRKSMDMFSAV